MSNRISLPETKAKKVTYIVNALRKSVFEELDRSANLMKRRTPNYRISAWKCETGWEECQNKLYWNWKTFRRESCWNLNYCTYVYEKPSIIGDCRPFSLLNYPSSSPEYKLVEQLRKECKDDTIAKAVMETLLDEWKQREENAYRQKCAERKEQREKHIKECLAEAQAIANDSGVSVDAVLMIELRDAFYALQQGMEDSRVNQLSH